jgi:protein-tyrosine-phosphatase
MAEGIFKDILKTTDKNIQISSAGINAFEGDKANLKAIKVLKEKDIDISGHRARQLTIHMLNDADLILTMTYVHKRIIIDYIQKESDDTSIGNKVFTLKEYAYLISVGKINKHNLDIADPFGMDYNVYEQTMKEIEKELRTIVEQWRNNREAIDEQ